MREILFRGRNKRNGNGYGYGYGNGWVYGDYWTNGVGSFFIRRVVGYKITCIEDIEVDPETVDQYTGLCDKNGKKIFIGDIVHYVYEPGNYWNANENAVIEETAVGPYMKGIWGTNKYALMEGYLTTIPLGGTDKPLKCMEVIGNIHDNPELIGKVKVME